MNRDLDFISQPDLWPLWPFLPIKKPGRAFDSKGTAIIAPTHQDERGYQYTLFYANIFAIPEKLEEKASKSYLSADAVLADGWAVD